MKEIKKIGLHQSVAIITKEQIYGLPLRKLSAENKKWNRADLFRAILFCFLVVFTF